jgi:anaerobic selenocysteine-containing dehydrogenase
VTQPVETTGLHEIVSFCRICSGGCGTRITLDGDRITGVRGDPDNGLTKGYACYKGLQAAEAHHGSSRLHHPLKRMPDGSFVAIPLDQALDEIAERLAALIAARGPDSVGIYCGNGAITNTTAYEIMPGFLAAIGSRQYFSSLTIDQSGKMVAAGRLGSWAGGMTELDQMDVLLLFGSNPLLSHSATGIICHDPVRTMKQARARGMKLIVIDPRRTETGHFADLMLQPFPGQDAAIAAALIRIILAEGWEDADFCARFVGAERMAALREAVAPFTPEMVEAQAALDAGQLRAVAAMFARDRKRGIAFGSTGASMTAFSNLAQHLISDLNVICGRFPRAGEAVGRIDVQAAPSLRRAQVNPATRPWEQLPPSRIRGVGALFNERLSGTLAEEILTPGEGQLRALIVDGGNPALSLPDQRKAVEALGSLDLLVCIEPWETPTTKLADYVLPTLLQYEREDLSIYMTGVQFWPGAWLQHTAAVIPPPADSDLADDWYMFWALAARLGKQIVYGGKAPLPLDRAPETAELLDIRLAGARASRADLVGYPHGRGFDVDLGIVAEAEPGADGRFDVMPADVAGELADCFAHNDAGGLHRREGRAYSYLMTTRRIRDTFNSNGTQLAAIRARTPTNAAYLHGDELTKLGVTEGDRVELTSSHGRATFTVARDDRLRTGVVATTHCWGVLPDTPSNHSNDGTCVNLLIDADRHYEPINAMPHFSAVPVDIARVRA